MLLVRQAALKSSHEAEFREPAPSFGTNAVEAAL
jgi:hypothetical protein